MAGYIGRSQSVTQVDGYTQTEADSNFVDTSGDTMTGELIIGNDADTVLTLDRDTTDGPIIDLQKDGTSGGLIGVNGGRAFFARTSGGGVKLASSYGLEPCNGIGNDWDGVPSLGSSVNRFSNLHLKNNIYAKAMALKDTGSSHYNGIRCIDNNKIGFNTKGLERMRIDSAGRVTMPYQPSFCSYKPNNNNYATYAPLDWTTTHNTGNHFNGQRFTAPVAGLYHFDYGGITHSVTNYFYLGFALNGSHTIQPVRGSWRHLPAVESEYHHLHTSMSLYLNVGDYIEAFTGYNGGTPYLESNRTSFSGHLIG